MPTPSHQAKAVQNATRQSPGDFTQRYATLIALILLGAATTGYFLGLTSPMTAKSDPPTPGATVHVAAGQESATTDVIPATAYAEMPAVTKRLHRGGRTDGLAHGVTPLDTLRQEPQGLFSSREIDEVEKTLSLAHRETRRAFNGAPPTVPHPTEQLSSTACMACHGDGLRSKSLRASKMPHPYYASCTQCHVEQQAQFALASASFGNTFVGVKAPDRGDRAYQGAPPIIPHSTWMRNDCLSCHGRTAAPGMESTHPWRNSCLQCHGESSQLNQTHLKPSPDFLPPPTVLNSYE